jgi:hypothetical protein
LWAFVNAYVLASTRIIIILLLTRLLAHSIRNIQIRITRRAILLTHPELSRILIFVPLQRLRTLFNAGIIIQELLTATGAVIPLDVTCLTACITPFAVSGIIIE